MFERGFQFDADRDIPDLSGQIIIVTGGNTGLGFETIRQLAKHSPARIYLAARSKDKAEAAISELKRSNSKACPITFLSLDLSSFESIKSAVKHFTSTETRLDILVNNAGIMMIPEGLTEEGYEIQFGTNVIGPALFTQLLLPILQATATVNSQVRVVTLSSASERMAPKDIYDFAEFKTTMSGRNTTARYFLSKLAIIHYTSAMAERHKDVKFINVHPGIVATNLHHNSTGFILKPFLNIFIGLFANPVGKGALSQIWTAVSPQASSGEFYGPVGQSGQGSSASRNHELQTQLWTWIQGEIKSFL